MGYFGKLEEKEKAKRLRKKGYSYNQIKTETGLSKDTICRCCRDIELTKKQILALNLNRKRGQILGSIRGAKTNQRRRILSEERLLKKGIKQIGTLNKREKFMLGIAFYQGEGSKTGSGVEFTNSDPDTVVFMVRWFEEFCQIGKENLKCSLWLHDNLNEKVAIKYWSDLLGVKKEQFGKTYVAKNKINSKKIRKNIHKYGIIKIRYYDVLKLRLILGWIKGVLT